MHGLRDVIDTKQACVGNRRLLGEEIRVPNLALRAGFHEIDEAAAHAIYRGCWHLAGTDGLRELSNLQSAGASQGACNIFRAQPERAHRCTMHAVVGTSKALRLAIQNKVDAIL